MATFKETKVLNGEKLRNLCIKNNYYTKGNNIEYTAMFEKYCGGFYGQKKITFVKIEEVANNIFQHSNWSEYEKSYRDIEIIEKIIFELLNDCCISLVEIKE